MVCEKPLTDDFEVVSSAIVHVWIGLYGAQLR